MRLWLELFGLRFADLLRDKTARTRRTDATPQVGGCRGDLGFHASLEGGEALNPKPKPERGRQGVGVGLR